MSGKENCQYIGLGWVLSSRLDLKVLKDRVWINLGKAKSVGSAEKYTFKSSTHKVLKMLCDVDGTQGEGEVYVLSIEKAIDDASQNNGDWLEMLDDHRSHDMTLRNVASTFFLHFNTLTMCLLLAKLKNMLRSKAKTVSPERGESPEGTFGFNSHDEDPSGMVADTPQSADSKRTQKKRDGRRRISQVGKPAAAKKQKKATIPVQEQASSSNPPAALRVAQPGRRLSEQMNDEDADNDSLATVRCLFTFTRMLCSHMHRSPSPMIKIMSSHIPSFPRLLNMVRAQTNVI